MLKRRGQNMPENRDTSDMDIRIDEGRRQFLKLSAVAAITTLIPTEIIEPKEAFFTPEVLHGTEVYGLKEPIRTEEEVVQLYQHFDDTFAKEKGLLRIERMMPKYSLRKELLSPKERYLEVMVLRSAYESYEARKEETGVDFVQWIQNHVDYMNVCFGNAKPSAEMRAVLRRIVVVDDEMPSVFYDPAKKGELGGSLDFKWWQRNRGPGKDRFPLDIDDSWAIAEDYRPAESEDKPPYFWDYKVEGSKIFFGFPPGKRGYERIIEYPYTEGSLGETEEGIIECALPHEWGHYLYNLADEYDFDIGQAEGIFRSFFFATGNFVEPRISPYISYVSSRLAANNIRPNYGNRFGGVPISRCIPEGIEIKIQSGTDTNLTWNASTILRSEEGVSEHILSQEGRASNTLRFQKGVNDREFSNSNVIVLRSEDKKREIYLPYAAFNMSKIAGVENAQYEIQFLSTEQEEKTRMGNVQIAEIVDETDLRVTIQNREKQGDLPYAKMKIAGTNTWLVWFLKSQTTQ